MAKYKFKTKKLKKQSSKTKTVSRHISRHISKNTNETIIKILSIVKNYYASIKDNIHVNAYERAIYQIKKFNEPITSGAQLKALPGIGKGMIEKIDTIIKTGTLPIIIEKELLQTTTGTEKGDAETGDKNAISNILGFGEKLAKELKEKYGAKTIDDLEKLVAEGKISLSKAQSLGVKYHKDLIQLIPRDEITQIGSVLGQTVWNIAPGLNLFLAGSYPSGLKPASKDIDIIIVKGDSNGDSNGIGSSNITLGTIINEIQKHHQIEIFSLGDTKFLGLIKSPVGGDNGLLRHLDIRFVSRDEFPYCWLYYSSGKVFNKLIREKLKKKGYKLNEFGLFKNGKKIVIDEETMKQKDKNSIISNEKLLKHAENIEKEIFKLAGLQYMDVRKRY